MAFMNKKVVVTLKLPQLQNLIKRDPSAYKEEFLQQKRHFESELAIFKTRPTKDSDRFTELVTFMCHVSPCYPLETNAIATSLLNLLETEAMTLHTEVRANLLQSLILLRSKKVLDPLILLRLCFNLFAVPDKALRLLLGQHILNDIKAINLNKHNDKLNKNVQSMLYSIVAEDNSIAARKTVQILSELYRKRIWTDARTINVIGSACLNPITTVFVTAINFFLGIETKMHEDEDEDIKAAEVNSQALHTHSKKTRKRMRLMEKHAERLSKNKRDKEAKHAEIVPLFPAIQLLHDPQSLAEKLFKKLRQTGERFEIKILLMNFISRLIGCHKLIILSFYSFLQRYLTSHQQDVTRILAYLIQACHDLIPPEELLPLVKAIAHNFITERCSTEVVAVGLNAVREILGRVPALLREPDMGDFIQDLALYGRKSHKSVMVAAHGIVNLVRALYPTLLRKADRGKFHDPTQVPSAYGDEVVAEGVQGAELLEAYERGEVYINSDDEVVWKDDEDQGENEGGDEDDDEEEEEEEEDGEGSEDGWVDVDDDEDGEEVEDDDDEQEVDDEEDEDGGDSEEEEEDEKDDNDEGEESKGRQVSETPLTGADHVLRRPAASRIDAMRLLTSEDFALLDRLKQAQADRAKDPRFRSGKKRARGAISVPANGMGTGGDGEDDENGAASTPFAVDPESLGPGMKTQKTSKVDRIMHVLEGRKDSKFDLGGHAGGLTNKEKLRKKNFVMVRKGKRSVTAKVRKSNSDTRYEKMHKREQLGREKRKRRRT